MTAAAMSCFPLNESPGCNPGLMSSREALNLSPFFLRERDSKMLETKSEALGTSPKDTDRRSCLEKLRDLVIAVRDAQDGEYHKDKLAPAARILGLTYARAENIVHREARVTPAEEYLNVTTRYERWLANEGIPSLERRLVELKAGLARWGTYRAATAGAP